VQLGRHTGVFDRTCIAIPYRQAAHVIDISKVAGALTSGDCPGMRCQSLLGSTRCGANSSVTVSQLSG
jgi:hypothetical protein